jgi:uncharacterized protein YjbI with pentapeptide repeats
MVQPSMKDDPLYLLLRNGKIEEFNILKQGGEPCDLSGADLRGVDLRGLDTDGLDLSGSYLRQADLRGLDLRGTKLEGASIHAAKISRVYFPPELSADEITLSLLHGTRMRYRT